MSIEKARRFIRNMVDSLSKYDFEFLEAMRDEIELHGRIRVGLSIREALKSRDWVKVKHAYANIIASSIVGAVIRWKKTGRRAPEFEIDGLTRHFTEVFEPNEYDDAMREITTLISMGESWAETYMKGKR
ncbi:MAG: hypothetical protein NDF52_05295 [archaeon YNP-WB-062]|jgi:hypothetical protein|nr:hypothetical protein [Candidatus Culexarchaeum yellowstonense]